MTRPIEPIALSTVLSIHQMQIDSYGGLQGLRDQGLLEAAVAQPWQGFAGIELYPTVPEKAARIGYEVISQHPFADANKRTGAALIGALLRANGIRFKPGAQDLYDTVVGVADGSLGYEELLGFVRQNIG